MEIDERVLGKIVQRVLGAARPSRILLFGSAAEGTMTPDSDIDLLVIHDGSEDAAREGVRIRAALAGMGYPFDVFVMSAEEFEETKNVIGGLAYPANKYGKVIHETAG
ncbi:MAG: nucleotidyltransferase domain-containing protein [Myxococcota bacterium]|nr:nucleotidyltransferase domain-containing protein [Myxococcota bacterium]